MMFYNGRFGIPDYLRYPAAWFYPRILVGPGAFLTQRFTAEMNITHVINCASDGDCPDWFPDRHPDRYLCLDGIDSIYVNILDWYPKFEAKLHEFLRAGSGVVYVHCQAGMNRSGSLALAYVCKNFHLPLEEVVVATRRQRPVLFQNPVFMNQVREFINGCLQSQKNTRLDVDRVHDGDSGLFTPDDRPGLEGLIVDAGKPEGGTGPIAVDDFGPLFEERSGVDREGEPAGDASEND
jgi:protein-tyrosine phosphatase